jgi:hypothetical protein
MSWCEYAALSPDGTALPASPVIDRTRTIDFAVLGRPLGMTAPGAPSVVPDVEHADLFAD